MRRNVKKILKYAIVAVIFLTLGPTTIRFLFGGEDNLPVHPMGLPVAPGDAGDDGPHILEKKHLPLDTDSPPAFKANQAVNAEVQQNNPIDSNAKKDWHNYELIAANSQRTGPGEQGLAVSLSTEEEKQKNDLFKVNGFNALASDKISLERALKDIRHPDCRKKRYSPILPTASIVVPFHNEHWSTLLRTAVSVIKHSPPELLKEVILVDDFSTKDFLKAKLDEHVATNYDGKVKVVRAKKREGLIRTRLLGAKAALGDVIIFLDSHCEATINWLPPLLDPIQQDYRTVVCPFIDVIDFENFAYRAQDEGARGAFDWEFFYKRLPRLPEDKNHPADPFDSPVMAGGLFAISTKWFWELGGYDPGLDIWGGEQYELSFKLWQCGGKMVDTPCSRVGHIYRKFAPFPNPGIGDFVARNYRRVAEVWMDEYAEYLYKRRPHYRNVETGDISAQLAIREKLQCKPFKWFMEEVAFDLTKVYPPVEPPSYAEGEMRNIGANMCVDTRFKGGHERFGIEPCITDNPGGAGGEQKFELTWHKDLRPYKRNVCFDVSQSIPKAPIILFSCHGQGGNQHFKYNLETKQIYHPISAQCLDCDKGSKEIYMLKCDSNSQTQKWKFDKVEIDKVKEAWDGKE